MDIIKDFLRFTLDTVKNNIVVVDRNFDIVYANKPWIEFGSCNGLANEVNWLGLNYIHPVEISAQDGDEFSLMALKGLRDIQAKKILEFNLEYPCHSATEDRWFIMQVNRFNFEHCDYFVISHQDITQRVKLEIEAKSLARVDSLTGLANRRAFDEFLKSEWGRCNRGNLDISIAIIDLDNFKYFNDNFGHQTGDECLKALAGVLQKYSGRASDLCARYGGDEFVIIWGNMTEEQAQLLANGILDHINRLSLKLEDGQRIDNLSVSIGVHSVNPKFSSIDNFISQADRRMFEAKNTGRNNVCSHIANIP